ncbi:MAG: DNA mismatch repair protein MutS, partial [Lachnospiraceae bacterium]|nr:DNA mismatch repair protein MutS [Lachnospiraceae bacterium]
MKTGEIDRSVLSPMMQHYLKTRDENPGCILFYRLGDFYEMFFEDAELVSKELELTLTGKSCGLEERAPMCGVPFHAADTYITRLVGKGYRVAVCEQVEDPKEAKGMVRREVIRIVTPGTNCDTATLDDEKNNFIMCIAFYESYFGLATCDVSTGEFYMTQVSEKNRVYDEIIKLSPTEIICNELFFMSGISVQDLRERLGICVSSVSEDYFRKEKGEPLLLGHFRAASLQALGLDNFECGTIAAGALMGYLCDTQKIALSHITHINTYLASSYMLLDASTRRNLELTQTLREKRKAGSLFGVLDRTRTAMGGRLLRSFIEQPLTDGEEIEKRLDCVSELFDRSVDREEIREYLAGIYDLERLLSRISYRSANPRDLISFKNSLRDLPAIKELLKREFSSPLIAKINESMDSLSDLYHLIDAAISDDAPIASKEGGIIKEGYSSTVDQLKKAGTEGKTWLAKLEEEDRERTGIKNLRIKYNRVFGYYFEVTNSYKDMVPEDYIRKQTLTGSERYTNEKLKELEDTILNAQDRLLSLEYDLFTDVRDRIFDQVERIQRTAKAIAELDT